MSRIFPADEQLSDPIPPAPPPLLALPLSAIIHLFEYDAIHTLFLVAFVAVVGGVIWNFTGRGHVHHDEKRSQAEFKAGECVHLRDKKGKSTDTKSNSKKSRMNGSIPGGNTAQRNSQEISLAMSDAIDPSLCQEQPGSLNHGRKYDPMNRREAEAFLFAAAKASATNNVVNRQLRGSCVELDNFDRTTEIGKRSIRLPQGKKAGCYGCGTHVRAMHPVYVFSCSTCGQRFQSMRHLSRSLTGCVSLVIGCRTKLGHQVALKLLRAGSIVIGTTRRPEEAMRLFALYHDGPELLKRLIIYPHGLDLDVADLVTEVSRLREFIDEKTGVLDNLIICAAQTIRARDKDLTPSEDKNRYGDPRFVNNSVTNSWQMTLHELPQSEMEEVLRVNAVAPCLIVQTLSSLMQNSKHTPYIVNVHAREGLFQVRKSASHIHTNMAKAALAMLTKCLLRAGLKTHAGVPFSIHGCDPGWISVDEYYENDRPWNVPPLDEVDGAARILFPIFRRLDSCAKTRRHFFELSY